MAVLTYISQEDFLEMSPTLNHSSRIHPGSFDAWAGLTLDVSEGVQRTIPIQILTTTDLYIIVTVNSVDYFLEA